MNLLFVIKALGLPGGGAERVLADVTRGIAERGHKVTVASFDPPETKSFYSFSNKVTLVHLGLGDVSKHTKLSEVIRRIFALRGIVQKLRPDVAVGFMHSAYVPLALAMAGIDVPVVGSEHIIYSHYASRPIERAMLRIAAPFLTGITAVTKTMRSGFPSVLRRRMIVIANPVKILSSSSYGSSRRGAILLTVGRLTAQKDHRTLIAAFREIADDLPDWHLRIVGDGELRNALQSQIAELGLEDRVALIGAVQEIDCEYEWADLFVMPSLYESFGLATAEALAHGLPVVGFADCPGTNELIEHENNGLLVDGGDRVQALAAGLAQLMTDSKKRVRMAKAAPGSVQWMSCESVVEAWEAFLEAQRRG